MSDPEFQNKLLAADGIVANDPTNQMSNIKQVQARETLRMKWAKRLVIGLWVLYATLYVAAGLAISSWRASAGDAAEEIDLKWWESLLTMSLIGLAYVTVIVTVWWLIRYVFFRLRQIQFALAEVQVSLERIGQRLDSLERHDGKKPGAKA